jgi:hypothetical protein
MWRGNTQPSPPSAQPPGEREQSRGRRLHCDRTRKLDLSDPSLSPLQGVDPQVPHAGENAHCGGPHLPRHRAIVTLHGLQLVHIANRLGYTNRRLSILEQNRLQEQANLGELDFPWKCQWVKI